MKSHKTHGLTFPFSCFFTSDIVYQSTMAPKSAPKTPKATKASKTTPKAARPSKVTPSKSYSSKKDQIFRYICKQYVMGIVEVDKMGLALAVDNKNPRSEGFHKSVHELLNENILQKGQKKDTFSLTDKGIKTVPKDLEMSKDLDPASIHNHFIGFIQDSVKMGADKVPQLWEILMDFEPHSIVDISKDLGYGNPRSFSNTKIISTMKDMGLIDGKKDVMFTDKVPRLPTK